MNSKNIIEFVESLASPTLEEFLKQVYSQEECRSEFLYLLAEIFDAQSIFDTYEEAAVREAISYVGDEYGKLN